MLSLRTALAAFVVSTAALAATAADKKAKPPAKPAAKPAPPKPAAAKPAAKPVPPKPAAAKPAPADSATTELQPDEEYVEEIVVTGSRIPRVELTTAAPVTVMNRTQIESTGRPSIGDILQSIPSQSNATNTAVNNGGDGSTRINLRGLGSARTLTLINGRRVVPSGTGVNASVDMNSIPTTAIQRVEVLKDGASAVYGSDAIAGVINIITRRDFVGTEASVYSGISQYGDGLVLNMSGTTGLVTDKGNILFNGAFVKAQETWAGNRDWSKFAYEYNFGTDAVRTKGSPAALTGYLPRPCGNNCGNGAWQALVNQYPSAGVFTRDPSGQWRPFNDTGVTEAGGDMYNFQPENYLVTPSQRGQLFSIGEFKFSPDTRGYYEMMFTNRLSEQKLAPQPLAIEDGVVISKDNHYNPFGVDFPSYYRRLGEFKNRVFRQDLNTFRVVTGVTGIAPVWKGLHWDASLNIGRNDATAVNTGQIQKSKLQAAVGPSFKDANGDHCGVPGAVIPGCVPLNLFGGFNQTSPTITPEMIKYLSFDGTAKGFNQQVILAGSLAGELFNITPNAQPTGFAVGYEFRVEEAAEIPDPLTAKGDTSGNSQGATEGGFFANEAYAELSAPVLGPLAPGAKDLLELDAAARYVHYYTYGTTNSTKQSPSFKIGARVSPIQDLTVRGTASTAFRAPHIGELYSAVGSGYASASDPCSSGGFGQPRPQGTPQDAACDAAGVPDNHFDGRTQIRSTGGGNPDLLPETAAIFTLGVVLQPQFLKEVSMTVDGFYIKVRDSISSYGAGLILSRCYPTAAGQQPLPNCNELVERDATTHLISNIKDQSVNVGGDLTSGIDVGARWEPETAYGRFIVETDWTWIAAIDTETPDGKTIVGKGNYDLGQRAEFTGTAAVTWSSDPFSVGLRGRFVGPFVECANSRGVSTAGHCWYDAAAGEVQPARRWVSPYAGFEVNGSWTMNTTFGTSVMSVGINNILNAEPPRIYNGTTATSDPSSYGDAFLGRFFWARVSHKF